MQFSNNYNIFLKGGPNIKEEVTGMVLRSNLQGLCPECHQEIPHTTELIATKGSLNLAVNIDEKDRKKTSQHRNHNILDIQLIMKTYVTEIMERELLSSCHIDLF